MKRVVFVCVENACRSQMAAGFAQAVAGPDMEIWSAGSRPSGKVNERAVEMMREAGVDISDQTSKGLDALPAVEWDAVVTMGCGDACPQLAAKARLDWPLPDPKHMPGEEFRKVRDDIRDRVARLIVSL